MYTHQGLLIDFTLLILWFSGCCNDAQHDAAGSGKSGGSLIDDTP